MNARIRYGSQFQGKLQTFIHSGPDQLQIIADFDRTLTAYVDHLGNRNTTFSMAAAYPGLKPGMEEIVAEYAAKYSALEQRVGASNGNYDMQLRPH